MRRAAAAAAARYENARTRSARSVAVSSPRACVRATAGQHTCLQLLHPASRRLLLLLLLLLATALAGTDVLGKLSRRRDVADSPTCLFPDGRTDGRTPRRHFAPAAVPTVNDAAAGSL